MDKNLFFQCLDNRDNLGQEVPGMLDATLEQYPYFLQARVLRLMAQKQHNHQQYSAELKTVSALMPNRLTLFFNLNPVEEVVKTESPTSHSATVDSDSPFALDEVEAVEQADDDTSTFANASEEVDERNGNLLELGDLETIKRMKEEAFLNPTLYTLDIPGEFIDDKEIESLYSKSSGSEGEGQSQDQPRQREKSEQSALIDAFIEANPRIVPKDLPNEKGGEGRDISLESVKEHEDNVIETLALIFVSQGKIAKAISIFEKLCLKYPEKRAYFAAQIEKLKNQQVK